MIGIYKITSPTGKVYIGQSIDISYRKARYEKGFCKNQPRVYSSLVKYGFSEHIFEVVEQCSIEILNVRERHWQDFYNVLGVNGLNCKLTTTEDKSGTLSESTRKKISAIRMGVPRLESTKERLRSTSYFHILDKDSRTKAVQTRRENGKYQISNETRAKQSQSHKGKKDSQETRDRKSAAQIGKKKKAKTSEQKAAAAELSRKYRDISCYTLEGVFIRTFKTIHEAVAIGYSHEMIRRCITGESAHHRKFIWKIK
jgi:group I intron endonuclease